MNTLKNSNGTWNKTKINKLMNKLISGMSQRSLNKVLKAHSAKTTNVNGRTLSRVFNNRTSPAPKSRSGVRKASSARGNHVVLARRRGPTPARNNISGYNNSLVLPMPKHRNNRRSPNL